MHFHIQTIDTQEHATPPVILLEQYATYGLYALHIIYPMEERRKRAEGKKESMYVEIQGDSHSSSSKSAFGTFIFCFHFPTTSNFFPSLPGLFISEYQRVSKCVGTLCDPKRHLFCENVLSHFDEDVIKPFGKKIKVSD